MGKPGKSNPQPHKGLIENVKALLLLLFFRYYETISEVLSSVKKMEESLKRLKQARKGTTAAATTGANGGPTDDSKIRLQLALDVEYLGEQVDSAESLVNVSPLPPTTPTYIEMELE